MRLVVSLLLFICVSTLAGILFAFNGLNENSAVVSLLIGGLVAMFYVLKTENGSELDYRKFSIWTWGVIFAYALFTLKSFLWLIYIKGGDLYVSSPNNAGDMALHISQIKYFAEGVKFWPDSNIIAGHKLRYSIGIDFFNSLLLASGFDLIRGLIWVGLLCSIITGLAFLIWGGPFALAGFLFNGGLAGFAYFTNGNIFQDLQTDLAWKSIPLTMFITQRGLLYAIPAGLILLTSWREYFFGDKNPKLIVPFWVQVILYSTMALFHMHTFIFLSLLLGTWILISNAEIRKKIFLLIGFSFIPATAIVLFMTDFFKAKSLIYIKPGWMISEYSYSFVHFWIYNFGILIPLVLFLCVKLTSKSDDNKTYFNFELNKSTAFVLPALALFVLFCFVMMAPWSWDNMKLLVWSYFIVLPFLWSNLIENKTFKIRALLCFVLFFSGFVCVTGGIDPRRGYKIISINEERLVRSAVKNLSIEDRFACEPSFQHPLLLAGRKIILGYPGWIWSHGYDLDKAQIPVKIIMNGEDGWEKAAKEAGIRYLFWGVRENNSYKASKRPWEVSEPILTGQWGSIYDLKPLINQDPNKV